MTTPGCIFQWKIKNFNLCCWLGESFRLVSPAFKGCYGTEWYLRLFPLRDEVENSIGFSLRRAEEDSGPRCIGVKYHIAFLDKDGSVLNGFKGESSFKEGEGDGSKNLESRNRIFFTEKDKFLPEGTLTVQCTLEETIENEDYRTWFTIRRAYVRSVFNVNRKLVSWDGSTKKLKDDLIDLDLIREKNKFEMNVISHDDSVKFISINISTREEIDYGEGTEVETGYKMRWTFFAMRNGDEGEFGTHHTANLPNEVFISNYSSDLRIDFFYSTLTSISYETPPVEKSKSSPVLIDSLKSMYIDGNFSDIKLCTPSRTFPAHRNILSARSPVFSRMFNNNMMEKSSGCVNITDFEDDTVHRMLLYIYSDLIEDLQFDSACKLYKVADKYEIMSLRDRCSSFLKDNISPTRACDALVMADLHQDEELKSFVQAYILENDDVCNLEGWKHFVENNPKLAADLNNRKKHPCKRLKTC